MHMVHEPTLSAIDLNLLVVLEALLSERHVTRAAARVGLSQSATSHALGRLRELYKDPLLVRDGSAMTLTPRALALLPVVVRSLADLRTTITGEPAFDPRTTQRVFRLGAVDYAQAMVLPRLLQLLEQQAPGIDLAITNTPSWFAQLSEGEVDLAFVVDTTMPSPIRSRALFSDGFVCMVRNKHPTVKSKLTLAEYLRLRHVVVAPSGAPGSTVDTELEKRGKRRRVALRVPSFLVAPLIVGKSDLINTLPERLAKRLTLIHPVRLL
ncbi:MAG: LysR family transcriptional regulator, partial [Polyangiales bacterium]